MSIHATEELKDAARTYVCPLCHAESGTKCKDQRGNAWRGRSGNISLPRKRVGTVHRERLALVERFGDPFRDWVPVFNHERRCSFPMRADAIAASDTCRHTAHSAVQDARGCYLYRCRVHEGMIDSAVRGKVYRKIPPAS